MQGTANVHRDFEMSLLLRRWRAEMSALGQQWRDGAVHGLVEHLAGQFDCLSASIVQEDIHSGPSREDVGSLALVSRHTARTAAEFRDEALFTLLVDLFRVARFDVDSIARLMVSEHLALTPAMLARLQTALPDLASELPGLPRPTGQ
jgi:hypothetical protein